jgi:hypothetical protein
MLAAVGLFAGVVSLTPSRAEACGCFAPPDPSVPVVQAGERIVFAHQDGKIIAHIQVQYQGSAQEFGWLLPLPAEPEMKLGVEELFTAIENATQPKYRLTRITGDSCEWGNGRGNTNSPSAGFDNSESDPSPPQEPGLTIIRGSVGPFDYAKIQADQKEKMFQWLSDNRFFVPANTENVVDQYINADAWFLALKLRKGEDVGDLQPVVVEYESDLPMIPIVLTSVAANPDMGIQVFVLGDHRAIPRNFRHTVLNDEHIDWFTAGQNYNEVVIKAVDEAKDHHSFITEYAGSSDTMKKVLNREGRFGDRRAFENAATAVEFVSLIQQNGFLWSSPLINTLKEYFPKTAENEGVPDDQYYQSFSYYASTIDYDFDASELTQKIWDRIVTPTIEAGELFDRHPKMTRMYTTLSPEEMTKDPVFSFNADLPDVSNVHEATLTYICSFFQDGPNNTPAILRLPDNREFYVKNPTEWQNRGAGDVPYSVRIELLSEEGAPVVEVDNKDRISGGESDEGCACVSVAETVPADSRGAPLGLTLFGLVAFAAFLAIPRKR